MSIPFLINPQNASACFWHLLSKTPQLNKKKHERFSQTLKWRWARTSTSAVLVHCCFNEILYRHWSGSSERPEQLPSHPARTAGRHPNKKIYKRNGASLHPVALWDVVVVVVVADVETPVMKPFSNRKTEPTLRLSAAEKQSSWQRLIEAPGANQQASPLSPAFTDLPHSKYRSVSAVPGWLSWRALKNQEFCVIRPHAPVRQSVHKLQSNRVQRCVQCVVV